MKKEESNELIVDAQIIEERTLEKIEYEINELTKQAQTAAVYYAINIGGRLVEAKEKVGHGEWEKWLVEKVNYSQRTAETYIQIFKEYGNTQQGFFGTSDPQAFSNLSFTKLVTLLAIPAEEREDFAENVDAENISVRELKAEVKKAQDIAAKALQQTQEAEEKYSQWEDEETARQDKLREEADAKQEEIDALKIQLEELSENNTPAESNDDELATIRADIEAEQKAKFQKKIDKLEKDKEKIQTEADELTAKLEESKKADEEIIRLKQEKADAEAALADMQKKLSISANPIMQSLDFYFKQTQANIAKIKDSLDKLKESDRNQYDKFSVAIKSTIEDDISYL